MKPIRSQALLILGFMLTGCTVGADYSPPKLDLDDSWVATEGEILAANNLNIPSDWWELFEDPLLTQLIQTALRNNHDLKIAEARIDEARANERLADSAFFPQIDATASSSRAKMGGILADKLENSNRVGGSGRWEIDIFGGNRRRSEAAAAGTEAAIADSDATRLRLIAEVSRNYVRLRGLQQQRALTQRNIALQQETVKITQAQFNERVVSRLDVLRARTQLGNTRTLIPQIDAEIYASINRITVLLGEKVKNVKGMLSAAKDIPSFPTSVVNNTPVTTLHLRPDIRAAERRLAQATALTGAAFSGFFPKLSLEGFFGSGDSSVYGSSNPWNITVGALMPLLNFGRIQAQVDTADAQQRQAYHFFKQSVLLAIEEVEVGYTGYFRESERRDMYSAVAREQTEAAYIAKQQYLNGIAPQLDLLNAEQNALSAETSYVIAKTAAADNIVRLYTALAVAGRSEIKKPTPNVAKSNSSPNLKPVTVEYPRMLKPGEDPNLYP